MRVPSRYVLRLVRYWWGLVPLLYLLLGTSTFYGSAVPYIAFSALVLVWSLLGAPAVCCAVNRQTSRSGELLYCRNNSSGLLLGCNQVRAHKWQKFQGLWWTAIFRRRGWKDLWGSPKNWISTISGILGIVLPAAVGIQHLLT